jgi:hypothetical protein
MPNTSVRAAAEGMPALNRRRLLLGAAAVSTAVAAATVAPYADAEPLSNDLKGAIAAFWSAATAYGACQAKEAALSEALEEDVLFPKWTPPGGILSIWEHRPTPFRTAASLEIEIARKATAIERAFADGMMNRAAYERVTSNLAIQGGEGMAFLREREAAVEASGYNEAYRLTDKAWTAAREAFYAVLCWPCQTIEDVRAKAACLLQGQERLGTEIDGEEFIACLSSFAGLEA